MALDREFEIGIGHACAVIRDADQPTAAIGDGDVDAGCAGINGVLDKLLDGRGRAFHDLAGSNPVNQDGIKPANTHAPLPSAR